MKGTTWIEILLDFLFETGYVITRTGDERPNLRRDARIFGMASARVLKHMGCYGRTAKQSQGITSLVTLGARRAAGIFPAAALMHRERVTLYLAWHATQNRASMQGKNEWSQPYFTEAICGTAGWRTWKRGDAAINPWASVGEAGNVLGGSVRGGGVSCVWVGGGSSSSAGFSFPEVLPIFSNVIHGGSDPSGSSGNLDAAGWETPRCTTWSGSIGEDDDDCTQQNEHDINDKGENLTATSTADDTGNDHWYRHDLFAALNLDRPVAIELETVTSNECGHGSDQLSIWCTHLQTDGNIFERLSKRRVVFQCALTPQLGAFIEVGEQIQGHFRDGVLCRPRVPAARREEHVFRANLSESTLRVLNLDTGDDARTRNWTLKTIPFSCFEKDV